MTTHSPFRSTTAVLIGILVLSVAYAPNVFAQKEYLGGPLRFKVNIAMMDRLTLEVVDGFEWVTPIEMSQTSERFIGKTMYPTITLRHTADGSNLIWDWYKNPKPREGSIELVDDNGFSVRSYALPMILPSTYRLVNTPEGVVEEIEVVTGNPTGEIK